MLRRRSQFPRLADLTLEEPPHQLGQDHIGLALLVAVIMLVTVTPSCSMARWLTTPGAAGRRAGTCSWPGSRRTWTRPEDTPWLQSEPIGSDTR